jgi:predicted nucleic acid-binding protein
MSLRFVDTNILLYTISSASADQAKRSAAIALLKPMDWLCSAQVLQEFYANAVKKNGRGISVEAATLLVEQFLPRAVVAIDPALVQRAIQISQRNQISYWDAAIIAAAARCGADELLSEDMNGGQTIEGVRVVNPFA